MTIDPKTPYPASFADLGGGTSAAVPREPLRSSNEPDDDFTGKTFTVTGPDEREKAQLDQVEQDSLKRYAGTDPEVIYQIQSGPIRPPVRPQHLVPKPLPQPTQQDLSKVLQAITEIYPLLKDYAPCRELSTAKTKLDEARLWIIELRNAIRHNEEPTTTDPDIPF